MFALVVSSGGIWACALTTTGEIECWSDAPEDTYGAIMWGSLEPPEGSGFTTVSAGTTHACALDFEGYPVCWGRNGSGEANPPPFKRFSVIDAGDEQTCGLTLASELVCWGYSAWETPSW